MFKIYVLQLLIMIVKFEMEAKRKRTGENYEFVGEAQKLSEIEAYIKYKQMKEN